MKKLLFVAVAALAMVFASCGKKLSPEAEKAWADFKEVASKLDSQEKIESLETIEDFTALNARWLEVNKAMLDKSVEIAAAKPELIDSMEIIANKVNPVIQKTGELLKAAGEAQAAGEDLEAAGEDLEAAAEDSEAGE